MAILALALGIGPNTAIFSIVYANLLAPLPYPNPDQLVMVWSRDKGERNQVSAADFVDWKRHSRSFQQLAAFADQDYNLSSRGQEPQYLPGERVSPEWFELLGESPMMGRGFRADDEHVFVLSHRCWVKRFGSDPKIIGRQFHLNDEAYTAIGVMRPGPWDRRGEEIWAPLIFNRTDLTRGAAFWFVMGRLKPGVSIQQAQQDMNAVAQRIGEQYSETNKGWSVSVEPLKNDFQSASTRANLWLALAAVGFVLLIACVNVANLLLASGTARQRELAVRQALGASRTQIAQQLLTESITLAFCGGFIGAVLATPLLKGILALLPPGMLSAEADVRLSLPVLLFTLALTLISGVLFGCAPVLQTGDVDVSERLKQGGRSATDTGNSRLRQVLVLSEFALALTLLAGAALTIHSFVNRAHIDLGVRTDRILTFYVPLPQARRTESFYHELLSKMEAIPGVRRAAAATGTPLEGTNFDMQFTIAGKAAGEWSQRPEAGFQAVTGGFFEVFGVRVERGRAFTGFDTANSQRVALVNETFVRRYLAGLDPLAQRLKINELGNGQLSLGPAVEWQVVGVFHDVQNSDQLGRPVPAEIYVPFAQSPWPQATVAVRTAIAPEKAMKQITAAVHSLDPNLPLTNVRTMNQIVHDRFVGDRFGTWLYGSLAGIALLLASLGIYGVVSYSVSQRTAEIGLRMALGASQSDVVLRVLKDGLRMAALGLGFGLAGAYWIGCAMQSTLYGTGVMDWPSLGAAAVLLFGAALLACYVPARRASGVDPMVALRRD